MKIERKEKKHKWLILEHRNHHRKFAEGTKKKNGKWTDQWKLLTIQMGTEMNAQAIAKAMK